MSAEPFRGDETIRTRIARLAGDLEPLQTEPEKRALSFLRRPVWLVHLTALSFILISAWVSVTGAGEISLVAEAVRIAALYAVGIFLATLEHRAEQRRRQTLNALRVAQSLIRELQASARKFEEAKLHAEESNEAKNEYLATVSHEIRTPLNGIIGMAQLALASDLTHEQRTCIESAHTSAQSLLRVINDILDFSKIEARKVDLQAVHFDLHDRVNEVVRSFGASAHRKGIELACHIQQEVPHHVVGDDGRLRQVLVNLIGNAVKFTEDGEVIVRIVSVARTKQDVMLQVSVRDTGPGVPEGREKQIFEAYAQGDEAISRRYGGTGLGLSISAKLVELMGGTIWVTNNEDAGSTFHFTARLWLQRVASVDPRPVLPVSRTPQRVLIVDDHRSVREIVGSMVRVWGLEAHVAASGEEAMRMLADANEQDQSFAFVLIDAELPGISGFDLAETIRRSPNLPGSVVMMLPSPGDFEGAARCRTMGISSYVTKPISSFELSDAITRALHTPLAVIDVGQQQTSVSPLRSKRRLDVLVADDDPVNRALASGLLRRWGHRATLASNGTEALARFDERAFDLVILDVRMPDVDGLEAAAKMRERESSRGVRTPILAVSAHAGAADRERCVAAGMDGYITKPLNARELFDVIEGVAGESAVSGEPEPDEEEDLLVTGADLLSRADGNRELALRISSLFIEDAPRMIAEIREAIAGSDASTLASVAHRLKGAASNFPAAGATAAAAKLEMLGRRGDLGEAQAVFSVLEQDMDDLIFSLKVAVDKLSGSSSAS